MLYSACLPQTSCMLIVPVDTDVIRHPKTREDEVHNCQAVIDTLSMDVLNTSLSHITGQDIVRGDPTAIMNLIEVFSSLLEYIVERISSDVSSENGGWLLSIFYPCPFLHFSPNLFWLFQQNFVGTLLAVRGTLSSNLISNDLDLGKWRLF